MSNVTLDPRMLLDPQIMQLENNDLAIWIKCRLWLALWDDQSTYIPDDVVQRLSGLDSFDSDAFERVSTWLTKLGLWERSIDDAGWILNTIGADQ